MADIKSPRDSFFKRLFGNLEIAADFLRNYLKPVLNSEAYQQALEYQL